MLNSHLYSQGGKKGIQSSAMCPVSPSWYVTKPEFKYKLAAWLWYTCLSRWTWASIIEHHRLGGLNHRNFLLAIGRLGNLRSRCRPHWFLVKTRCLAEQLPLTGTHLVEETGWHLGFPFEGTQIPFMTSSPPRGPMSYDLHPGSYYFNVWIWGWI